MAKADKIKWIVAVKEHLKVTGITQIFMIETHLDKKCFIRRSVRG